jgi:hypothetical protein
MALTGGHAVAPCTGNPAILLTPHHATARHSQLPKVDVAGSIPIAPLYGPPERRPPCDQGPAQPSPRSLARPPNTS